MSITSCEDEIKRLREIIKSQAADLERLRLENVQEAKDLTAYRECLKQKETQMTLHLKEIRTSIQRLEVKSEHLNEKEQHVMRKEQEMRDKEADLLQREQNIIRLSEEHETRGILKIEQEHQVKMHLLQQTEKRTEILLSQLEAREKLLANRAHEFNMHQMGVLQDLTFREAAIKQDVIRAQSTIHAKKEELQEKLRTIESKLEVLLQTQSEINREKSLIEERTKSLELKKQALVVTARALHGMLMSSVVHHNTFIPANHNNNYTGGSEILFSANSLSPQAMSSECVSMERNSSDPSLSPQVIVPQTDVENAHQQLTNLQTYATQRGVPGESFRTLEVELQAIAEGKDGKGALEMDEWWRRLALCSQTLAS